MKSVEQKLCLPKFDLYRNLYEWGQHPTLAKTHAIKNYGQQLHELKRNEK